MSPSVIRAVIFVLFNIILVVHAKRLLPVQSDVNIYLTCLHSSREQLTFDASSFLEEFTNIVLQTVPKEEGSRKFSELEDLDYALKSYFREINQEDFEEGGLLVVSQLMSQCFRKNFYRNPVFVDTVSAFIYGLKEKAELTRSNSIPSEDQRAKKIYNQTKAPKRTQSSSRKAVPVKVPLSSKPVSEVAATYNHNSLKSGQSYNEKETFKRASEPTNPVYSLFASSFFENVATSRPLQRLFKSIMMTTLARKNFYYAFYRASKMFDLPNPEMFASTVSLAIGETFHSLSSCSFINIIANSVGQYLYNVKVLNEDNYFNLATQLANELSKSLINNPVGSRDVYLIQNLATGIVTFLYSLGLFTPRNAPVFARYLANELLFSKDNAGTCRYTAIPRVPSTDAPTTDAPLTKAPSLLNKDLRKVENEKFSSILLKRLTTSDRIPKLFELQLSPEDASKISYDYIYQLAASLDLYNPDNIATKIAGAIGSSPNSAKGYSFASIVAISLEKFLSEHSFLTPYNAETLVEAYLRELNRVVLTFPSSSYIDVFFEATYRFLINQLFLDTEDTNSFGSLFINELKSAESSEPPVFTALENNSSIAMFIWKNFPEIYSPTGLSSDKASTRVEEIADNLARNLSPTAGVVNVEFFTKLFLSTASDIYSDNPDLKTESLLLETLLETISALLQIIQNSSILSVPELSEMNLALTKAFISEIF